MLVALGVHRLGEWLPLSSDVDDSCDGGLLGYSKLREPQPTPPAGTQRMRAAMPDRRATYYCMWCRWPIADDGKTRLEGLSYLHPGECALLRVCAECGEYVWASFPRDQS